VAGDFGVRRGLAKGGNEELGPTMHSYERTRFPARERWAKKKNDCRTILNVAVRDVRQSGYGVIPAIEATMSRTASKTSSGTLPIFFGLRARQSTFLKCEQRTTPCTGRPGGSGTSEE
jgi:hypothetical protein